jgi:AraC family transcriptional regulator of adaptative response / DNA-3-methyladenine glycosylase II
LHADALLAFLAARALPGVEECDGTTYRRSLRLPHGTATVALTPTDRWVAATLRLTDVRDLAPAVARCRRLLDLDADPVAVDATLGADVALSASTAAEPGVRVPRAVDGFEMAVRAIVGQQVSVAGARATLTGLLAAVRNTTQQHGTAHPHHDLRHGPGDHAFPAGGVDLAEYAHRTSGERDTAPEADRDPAVDHDREADRDGEADAAPHDGLTPFPAAEQVAELPDEAFRMPSARRETLRALAQAVAGGELSLDPGVDREQAVAQLTALPGIGAWTAGYVAMRAIGDPDVLLHTDVAARRGARALGLPDSPAALQKHAERWRPWRSYALIRLWRQA